MNQCCNCSKRIFDGGVHDAVDNGRTYCSTKCQIEYWDKNVLHQHTDIRKCLYCGISIEHKRTDAKYCSESCRSSYSQGRRTNGEFKPSYCHTCGISLKNKRRGTKFCSPTCQSNWWKRKKEGKPVFYESPNTPEQRDEQYDRLKQQNDQFRLPTERELEESAEANLRIIANLGIKPPTHNKEK